MSENTTPNRKVAKVQIDRNACIGAATCVVISPNAFALDNDGIATVLPGALSVSDDELITAAQSCPTQAILLFDEAGNQIFPAR